MPAAAGFAHFQAIAEWKTRYKGYGPGSQLIDPYARFVTDRWVYLIAATAMPYEVDERNYSDAEIIREYYVDDRGKMWATTQATPYAPIDERGDPVRADGVGYPGGLFPRLTSAGHAVWSWLILSPFQLPSSTIKVLDSKEYFAKIRRHVPPLWDWQRTSSLVAEGAALTSKDGWSLLENPLWLSRPAEGPYASYGSIVRVAVGVDPFAIAVERSRAYVDLYRAYQERFEPLGPTPGGEYQRMALVQMLDDVVVSSDRAREKFGKYVDIGKLNAEITAYREERRQAIEKYEQAATRVGEAVLSELFGALLDGAMDTEGVDDGAKSPRLEVALTVLAHCARYLGSSKGGAAVLRAWAIQSEKDERHFTNRIILPTVDEPPQSHIKTFRWGAKAIASILVQYASHKVSVARIRTQQQVVDMLLEPLAKVSGNKSIKSIGAVLDEAVATGTISPKWLHVDTGQLEVIEIHTTKVEASHVKFIEDWVDEGAAIKFGRDAKLVATKALLAAMLDTINLALACQAAVEKIDHGTWPGVLGAASMGAHALNLSATIVEACAAEYGVSAAWTTQIRSAISGVRGVASAVFAVSNVHSAVEAYEKHDYSVGTAMAVAALAEATSCAAYIYTAVVSTSAAGPWVMLGATVVSAAAYIVATWTKDEPLQVFLENCEYGRAPYGEDYRPAWADLSIGRWRSEFVMQQRLLMKIIGRFTVSEASRGNPIVGIKVELSNFTPRSVLTVRFDATHLNKDPSHETVEFTGSQLPDTLPGVVKARTTKETWDAELHGSPESLVAVVRFQLLPGSQAEEVRFQLLANRESVRSDPVSSVE